ncbi:unnamed protein product, partial [marine sediment metagenome]
MMKMNTKNFWVLALLVVLLTGVVLTSGCVNTGGGTPELYIPVGQSLTGAIQVRGSDTYYSVNIETLRAYGGAPLSGYTWTVASLSALPPGTTVDPLTGIFHSSGGMLVPGTHTFDMTVSDGSRTATGTFTFVVNTGEI